MHTTGSCDLRGLGHYLQPGLTCNDALWIMIPPCIGMHYAAYPLCAPVPYAWGAPYPTHLPRTDRPYRVPCRALQGPYGPCSPHAHTARARYRYMPVTGRTYRAACPHPRTAHSTGRSSAAGESSRSPRRCPRSFRTGALQTLDRSTRRNPHSGYRCRIPCAGIPGSRRCRTDRRIPLYRVRARRGPHCHARA